MEYEKCPICGSPANIIDNTFRYSHLTVTCYRCGKYKIEEEVIQFEIENNNLSPEQIANISGWIREKQGSQINIDEKNIKLLITLKTPTAPEKADKILIYLAKEFPIAGSLLNIEFSAIGNVININNFDSFQKSKIIIAKKLLPLISIGRIINKEEFIFIIETYLGNEKGYLSDSRKKITPKGWAYLEEINKKNVSLHIVSYMIDYLIQKKEISNFPKTSHLVNDIKQTYERNNNLELSTIGHKCRELLQIFTTEIITYKKIKVYDKDITHTKNRLIEVLSSLKIGKTKPKFIEKNYDYIDVLIDLVQRQEHAGTKESETLNWNDARRIILHCVVFIVDLIDLSFEYS